MWKTFLNNLAMRKRRLLATSVAIVLGVAFLVGAMSFGNTLRSAMTNSYDEANRGTAVAVRGSNKIGRDDGGLRNLLPAEMIDTLRTEPGVDNVVATVGGMAQILDRDGERVGGGGPPTIGGNWLDDPRLNPYRIVDGRAPADVPAGTPYEVVIDRRSAETADLQVGDQTRVATPEVVEVTIVGIATFGSYDSQGPVTFTGFAPDAAQTLLGEPGKVNMFRIAAAPGTSPEGLRTEIAAALPDGAEAVTGSQLSKEAMSDLTSEFLGVFEKILMVFGGIAVMVATLSIHNTFAILAAQRSREAALLRAVGATRRQVLAGNVGEALVVGIGASALGIGGGYAISSMLRWIMARADVMDLGDVSTVMSTSTILLGVIVGIGVTLVASIGPALRSSRVAAIEALRDSDGDEQASIRVRTSIGAVLFGAGVSTMLLATRSLDRAAEFAALGGVGVLVGAVMLGPAIARPASRLLGVPGRAASHQGRLARDNAVRNRKRTAGAAAALMIGTAVVALFATFGASTKASLTQTIDRSFGGDLVLAGFDSAVQISPQAVETISALPEVKTAATVGITYVQLDGEATMAMVTDFDKLAEVLRIDGRGNPRAMATDNIAVSEQFAREHHLNLGSSATVTFPDRQTMDVTVGLVVGDRQTFGDMAMMPQAFAGREGRVPIVQMLIGLAPGVDEHRGAAAVNAAAKPFAIPEAKTRSQFIDDMGDQVDGVLFFIYGFLAIAVLIAVMSIANTLSLSIHERIREFGLLRAIGQSRRQVRAMVRWESVIVAVLGAACGLLLGTGLGWGLMRAIAVQEGWGVFAVPTATLIVMVILAVVAGVLAAWRPARRAAKLNMLVAISGGHGRMG